MEASLRSRPPAHSLRSQTLGAFALGDRFTSAPVANPPTLRRLRWGKIVIQRVGVCTKILVLSQDHYGQTMSLQVPNPDFPN